MGTDIPDPGQQTGAAKPGADKTGLGALSWSGVKSIVRDLVEWAGFVNLVQLLFGGLLAFLKFVVNLPERVGQAADPWRSSLGYGMGLVFAFVAGIVLLVAAWFVLRSLRDFAKAISTKKGVGPAALTLLGYVGLVSFTIAWIAVPLLPTLGERTAILWYSTRPQPVVIILIVLFIVLIAYLLYRPWADLRLTIKLLIAYLPYKLWAHLRPTNKARVKPKTLPRKSKLQKTWKQGALLLLLLLLTPCATVVGALLMHAPISWTPLATIAFIVKGPGNEETRRAEGQLRRLQNEGRYYFIYDSLDELPPPAENRPALELYRANLGLTSAFWVELDETGGVVVDKAAPWRTKQDVPPLPNTLDALQVKCTRDSAQSVCIVIQVIEDVLLRQCQQPESSEAILALARSFERAMTREEVASVKEWALTSEPFLQCLIGASIKTGQLPFDLTPYDPKVPGGLTANISKAIIYYQNGKLDRAEEEAKRVLQMPAASPSDQAAAYRLLGQIDVAQAARGGSQRSAELASAIRNFERAAEWDNRSPEIQWELAHVYYLKASDLAGTAAQADFLSRAIEIFNTILRDMQPESCLRSKTNAWLSEAYRQAGEARKAAAARQAADETRCQLEVNLRRQVLAGDSLNVEIEVVNDTAVQLTTAEIRASKGSAPSSSLGSPEPGIFTATFNLENVVAPPFEFEFYEDGQLQIQNRKTDDIFELWIVADGRSTSVALAPLVGTTALATSWAPEGRFLVAGDTVTASASITGYLVSPASTMVLTDSQILDQLEFQLQADLIDGAGHESALPAIAMAEIADTGRYSATFAATQLGQVTLRVRVFEKNSRREILTSDNVFMAQVVGRTEETIAVVKPGETLFYLDKLHITPRATISDCLPFVVETSRQLDGETWYQVTLYRGDASTTSWVREASIGALARFTRKDMEDLALTITQTVPYNDDHLSSPASEVGGQVHGCSLLKVVERREDALYADIYWRLDPAPVGRAWLRESDVKPQSLTLPR